MQNYEEFRQKEDVTYEEIKTTTDKTEMNHLVVKPRNQWLKQFLLILLISVLSAGVASTITYLTLCGKSENRGISNNMHVLYVFVYKRNIDNNKHDKIAFKKEAKA